MRGHGDTSTDDDDDLSAETMATDIASVLEKLYEESPTTPNFLLMGHSMGGAVNHHLKKNEFNNSFLLLLLRLQLAVHVGYMRLIPTLIGIIVIDVVEGVALDSLQSMQSFLRSRPNHFKSITTAIEWCVRSGQIRNVESAKVMSLLATIFN